MENNNNKALLSIILVLLFVIIGEVYYFWTKANNTNNIISNSTKQEEIASNNQKVEETNTKKTANKKVNITFITDKRCGEQCDVSEVIKQLETIPSLANWNLNSTILDYSDKKAKDILSKAWITKLPAVILADNKIPELEKYLIKTKDWKYTLNIGASFDPIAYEELLKRPEKAKQLDVFTMWYCPFGEIALKTLPQLQKAFAKDWIKLNVHYIATKTWEWNKADSFSSLHWVKEAEEDIRQLCIKKNYWFDKLVSYLQKRYENADNYWRVSESPEDTMKKVWFDVKKINTCVNSWEWAKMLEEDIKLAQKLNINASPTWFANNKYKFGGINANSIKENFCKYNKNLAWCKTEIKWDDKNSWNTPTCNN